ncbi:hypothetical protein V5P93_006328 [Actinokineospora auranticolor]|uniref:50S ribosome-binding GTPase n=1 Tax=Actinokineospora auranticolor TaxID=155976 RepID=A0A2S6GFV7_9PSEU|nr:hypothetical protein [Actinokineospora auranticolor]PPK64108.1 hypothetical protein CLV40_12299 [Actinokineospora auranticolor]
MTAAIRDLSLRVGLVGPSRIGKSTIVNCLLRSGESLLARTSVRMRWADAPTENKIQDLRDELEGRRVSGQFEPGAMCGTEEPFRFRLKFDPGLPDAELHLDLLDHPGGWLDPRRRVDEERRLRCREFIATATVLLIPVDAVVLMETVNNPNQRHVPRTLTLSAVEDVVTDWARHRHRQPGEPAPAIFCPVRTESCFADNGGRRDRSAQLLARVREVYGPVLSAIRTEAPRTRVQHCPIDTMGCVEFRSGAWRVPEGTRGAPQFLARYRIRRGPDGRPPELSAVGADDVLALVVRHLFDLGERALRDDALDRHQVAPQLAEQADLDAGLLLNLCYRTSGRRAQWRAAARTGLAAARSADELVLNLSRQLKHLAEADLGSRVRDLCGEACEPTSGPEDWPRTTRSSAPRRGPGGSARSAG